MTDHPIPRRIVVRCTVPGCKRPCAILVRDGGGDLILEILHRHGMDRATAKHTARVALRDLQRIGIEE